MIRFFGQAGGAFCLLVGVSGISGCTLIGAGIGSAVPAYETAPPPSPWVSLERGAEVRIVLWRRAPLWACHLSRPDECGWIEPRRRVSGRYEGVSGGRVWVVRGPDGRGRGALVVGVDPAAIESFDVRDGSHWGAGALVGAAVDVVVLAIAANAIGPLYPAGQPH